MNLSWKVASGSDFELLAEWNHQLIQDEGHRNPMTIPQLRERMANWIGGEYEAVLFSSEEPVAYALFRKDADMIYLRQFFVRRDQRRAGVGKAAFALLRSEIWPQDMRLMVDVLCRNEAAIAFWRSMGYQDYCLSLEILP